MKKTLRILAIVYGVYLVISLLIITPILNILPHRYVEQHYDRELSTDWILLNPFKLSLDIRNASLNQPDGEPFASFKKASVNLSLQSIWNPGWVLDVVKLKDLVLRIEYLDEGVFNFSDLLVSDASTEPTDETDGSGEIPGITVRDVDLHAKHIQLADLTRSKPYANSWDNFSIRIEDLSTVLEEGKPYHVEFFGPGGGKLAWTGEVSLPLSTSDGSLTLSEVSLITLSDLIEPWVALAMDDGRLNVQGDYRVNWGDELQYAVENGRFGLSSVSIVPRNEESLPDTRVQLAALELSGIGVDSTQQTVVSDSLTIGGLQVDGWQEGEKISLQTLFEPKLDHTAAAPDPNTPVSAINSASTIAAQDPNSPSSGTDEWSASLKRIELRDSRIGFRSEFTEPPLMQIQPLEITVDNVRWPLEGESGFTLALAVNERALLNVAGKLAPALGDGSLSYDLQSLPLPWFNPNLPEVLNADINDGALNIDGEITLAGFAPSLLALNASIEGFASVRHGDEDSFTSWKNVSAAGLSVDFNEQHAVLDTFSIVNFEGRIHIAEDGTINAADVLAGDPNEPAAPADATESTADAQDVAQPASQPWTFEAPRISITESNVDFMDQSLPINFRTVIGDLNGEIVGISSDPAKAAEVDLRGTVDGYAPVTLAGTFSPAPEDLALDLTLNFEGVDMALFSPYSANYAGYAIDQGLMNLELQYALQDSKLQGNNALRLDQLKLGEKIDSEEAVDLPLELALSIMTDANGVIDLAVPVSGDLEDPSFSLGGVIGSALVNTITKIVTAPFSILANLVGSEEDLQRITFPAGSAELDASGQDKLSQLSGALSERPRITLQLTGRLKAEADRDRIQRDTVRAQLLEDGLPPEALDEKTADWEKAVTRRYQRLTETASDENLTAAEQYKALAANIAVSDSQLLQLAEDRAIAVKTYLVTNAGLAADRAVIAQGTLDAESNLFSGVELSVD